MIRVLCDVGKNRVLLEFSGQPSQADLTAAEIDLRAGLARLRSPVDVLSDVSQLDSLEAISMADLERTGAMLRELGVRRVVRVVGRSKSGALQMERISRLLKHSAHLAFSREEAEDLLSQR